LNSHFLEAAPSCHLVGGGAIQRLILSLIVAIVCLSLGATLGTMTGMVVFFVKEGKPPQGAPHGGGLVMAGYAMMGLGYGLLFGIAAFILWLLRSRSD
jgi:hypothetical protein